VSDDTLPLFDEPDDIDPGDRPAADPGPDRTTRPPIPAPLAERMRSRSIDEIVGQEELLGEEGVLRRMIEAGHLPNLILHGPPGTGKTTLALLIAQRVTATFVPFSAVSEGVPRLREIVKQAEARRRGGRRTVLFIDEIHRLNKGQQDFLLPAVESGLVTLIGATTEHPAFEINPALLSRTQILVLEPLSTEALEIVLRRALTDEDRGVRSGSGGPVRVDDAAREVLLNAAGGDARRLLVALEAAAGLAGADGIVSEALAREAMMRPTPRYDASLGYEMLSAFHKSLRSSAGSAALYWAARMIRGGEEPLVLFRRLIAAAYEDVGLADPQAGVVAVQAMLAYERLGSPEGLLALANAILYVAHAPKSNRAYLALGAAMDAAESHPDAPVPLHLRNPTTGLMRSWGFGVGYLYAHDHEGGVVDLQCLPDELRDAEFYAPTDLGYEKELAERIRQRRARDG
jgi:putative ATPase